VDPPRHALRVAIGAAERAGRLLLKGFRGARRVRFKRGIGNLVTDMDHASEELVVRAIRRAFPDHEVIAEERGAHRADSPYRWHIDPLDGTANYAAGFPHWAVSIALEGLAGVVYNPIVPEMFTATANGGARRNGSPIRVSRTSDLRRALLATGFSYDPAERRRNLRHFCRFMERARAIRRAGSAALDFCYVACGIFDGYWELNINSWDMAAGALIVRESGGRVTDLSGGPFDLQGGESLATNGRLHAVMAKVLARG
jgi:myo-inositol-1(or 4)-monophosphatase